MSSSLFETCAAAVLGSPYLLDRASLHLPRGISHFLLYLAAESGNQLAVKKLVAKWPHGDLTLDFVSESSLCRRHRCRGSHCLEPHEYVGVFGSYARYSSVEIVSSLLDGVFYNLHYYRGLEESQGVGLRHIDMSAVALQAEIFPLLLNLVKGSVPASHLSNYSDSEVINIPHILNRPTLSLLVSVVLKRSEDVSTLAEICLCNEMLEVRLKGMTPLRPHWVPSKEEFEVLAGHVLGHIHIMDVNGWLDYAPDGSLSLWTTSSETHKGILDCRDLLLLGSKSSERLAIELRTLTSCAQSLRSFCLLWHEGSGRETAVAIALGLLLESLSSSLEFLQLQWFTLTSADLDSIQKCSKLRVLSVSSPEDTGSARPRYSVPEVLTVVSQLPLLELFHWSEGLNMTTHSLLVLRSLLKDSFKSLRHFHVSFSSLLLSTTDFVNDRYSTLRSVLLPLVGLKEGSEAVTTFIFSLEGTKDVLLAWLSTLRPHMCFKLGKQFSQLHELFRAAHRIV